MKKMYKIYYGLLTIAVLAMVVFTLYQGSLVVAFGKQQQKLKQEQVELLAQQQQLQVKLAEKNSLAQHSQEETVDGYELISHPIIISSETSLAAAD